MYSERHRYMINFVTAWQCYSVLKTLVENNEKTSVLAKWYKEFYILVN